MQALKDVDRAIEELLQIEESPREIQIAVGYLEDAREEIIDFLEKRRLSLEEENVHE